MIAIVENRENVLKTLLAQGKDSIDLHAQDEQGMSPAHLVVNPLPFGSYENENMLKMIAEHGF